MEDQPLYNRPRPGETYHQFWLRLHKQWAGKENNAAARRLRQMEKQRAKKEPGNGPV